MFTVEIDHMDLHQIANSGQCFRWQQINDNTYKIPAFGKNSQFHKTEIHSFCLVMRTSGIVCGRIISM